MITLCLFICLSVWFLWLFLSLDFDLPVFNVWFRANQEKLLQDHPVRLGQLDPPDPPAYWFVRLPYFLCTALINLFLSDIYYTHLVNQAWGVEEKNIGPGSRQYGPKAAWFIQKRPRSVPCTRLARGKFKLTNQDSAAWKKNLPSRQCKLTGKALKSGNFSH